MACNMNVIIFVTLRGDLFKLKCKKTNNLLNYHNEKIVFANSCFNWNDTSPCL